MGSDSIEGRVEGADGREGRITKRDILIMGVVLGVSLGIMGGGYALFSAVLDRSNRIRSLNAAQVYCRDNALSDEAAKTLIVPATVREVRVRTLEPFYHVNKTCDKIFDEYRQNRGE